MSKQNSWTLNHLFSVFLLVLCGISPLTYGEQLVESEASELQQQRLKNARFALMVPNGDWRSALSIYTEDMEYR
ncbi:MAG: hypothetical protein AB8G05_16430 [Oligoflexales bacterium]